MLKEQVSETLKNAINEKGMPEMLKEYHETTLTLFTMKYRTSDRTCRDIFGKKGEKRDYITRNSRIHAPSGQDIREGIKTDLWERKPEVNYWEKKGFTIVQQSYLKTNKL